MTQELLHPYHVRWGDLDSNGHMANRAFLDVAGDVRMRSFAAMGFAATRFREDGFGPVIRSDNLIYKRELGLGEAYFVNFTTKGLSPDGARFAVRNQFLREDGTLAAEITSYGGWLDLHARALRAPPDALLERLRAMPQSDPFEVLPALKERP